VPVLERVTTRLAPPPRTYSILGLVPVKAEADAPDPRLPHRTSTILARTSHAFTENRYVRRLFAVQPALQASAAPEEPRCAGFQRRRGNPSPELPSKSVLSAGREGQAEVAQTTIATSKPQSRDPFSEGVAGVA
jgi:hypothetical protein